MNLLSVFRPTPSIYETKFHRGFQRRRSCDHASERAIIDDFAFERFNERTRSAVTQYLETKRNAVTGEGYGEIASKGKRSGNNANADFLAERGKESRKRVRGSACRFFSDWNTARETAPAVKCQSLLVGDAAGRKRNRTASLGIFDNFRHTQAPLMMTSTPAARNNVSQISFG